MGSPSGSILQFLPDDDPAKKAWSAAWPTQRTGPNWEAIAQLDHGASREWLLVEAKANLQELSSSCGADADSLDVIRQTLNETKTALGVPQTCKWMSPYYQFCNRLAALHVMNNAGSAARLLYVYFYGDVADARRTCPSCEREWAETLAKQDSSVGLPPRHRLEDRIHKLFIDVRCVN